MKTLPDDVDAFLTRLSVVLPQVGNNLPSNEGGDLLFRLADEAESIRDAARPFVSGPDISKLAIEPGDVVVFSGDINEDDMKAMVREMSRSEYENNLMIFLEDGSSIESLRPDVMERFGWVRIGDRK